MMDGCIFKFEYQGFEFTHIKIEWSRFIFFHSNLIFCPKFDSIRALQFPLIRVRLEKQNNFIICKVKFCVTLHIF
jgi:hypothetical protein